MKNPQTNKTIQNASRQAFIEKVLLTLFIAVLTIRIFSIESPNTLSVNQLQTFTSLSLSLSLSFSLLLVCLFWLVSRIRQDTFQYRLTYIETGLVLFAIALCISAFAASNKRAALTDLATMLTPIIAAIVLVQILNTPKKMKTLLYAISILGTLTALYSLLQYFWANQLVIDKYHQDPNSILNQLGITKDSLNQMLFEHSLYSRDVRAFFTTGNSAGSFAILTISSALALLIQNIKQTPRKSKKLQIAISSAMLICCIAALAVTRSKGAILAFTLAAIMTALYFTCSAWLKRNWKILTIIAILAALAVSAAAFSYVKKHNTLPGGNSMLVRYQYWSSALQMSLDHPITGVGGGNFSYYYPLYKNPAAIETVADPHNFILAMLAEYGIFGLTAFLVTLLAPLFAVIIKSKSKNHTSAILIIAATAFCLQNCIDFAIFEPAILTTFWTILAIAIASCYNSENKKPLSLKLTTPLKTSIVAVFLLLTFGYAFFILAPVKKVSNYIQLAQNSPPNIAQNLIEKAADADPLSPEPPALNAAYLINRFYYENGDPDLLEMAENSLLTAIKRNPADFENFEKLSATYQLLAANEPENKNTHLQNALHSAQNAADRYPGSARLQIQLAKIAEQQNLTHTAVEAYKKAVEIEDAYRKQFQIMYPNTKIFSRLGEDTYQNAKNKITSLLNQKNK
ncbi:MAG: O-antigen ligase family protein [Phycisphaerae bacterium]|nr:O-antigen ligase family protein [Phycisphaerae bacterium]